MHRTPAKTATRRRAIRDRRAFRYTHSATQIATAAPTPLLRYRTATPQKKPTVKKPYQETPFKKWFLMDFRKLFRIRCV